MRSILRVICLLGLLLGLSGAQWPGALFQAQVDPAVLDDTTNGQVGDFLVILRSHANLAQAAARAKLAAGRASPGDQDVLRAQVVRTVASTLRDQAALTQPGVLVQLRSLNAEARPFWIVNLIAVRGGRAVVDAMAQRPDVVEIAPNRAFHADLPNPASGADLDRPGPGSVQTVEWGIAQIHAPDVWALGYTGQGIRVGVADTGMQWDHPALQSHYLGWNGITSTADHNYAWWDAIHDKNITGSSSNPCGYNLQVPCDDHGHGTHTTGIAVGSDGANQIGVAPGAKWMGCRNMDHGVGRPSTYIECLQFFLAPTDLQGNNPRPDLHADVISNSYGCPASELCGPRDLQQAVANMRIAGIFMSVSAGNNGPACSTVFDPPGLEPSVITIGATDSRNQIAAFSSRGPVIVDGATWPKPDLVAPGVGVRSSYPTGAYVFLSGTSMAAPHVAGAVALLWSAYPSLRGNVDDTQLLLEDTALHLTSDQGCGADTPDGASNNVYGFGLVDVKAAFDFWPNAHFNKIYFPIFVK